MPWLCSAQSHLCANCGGFHNAFYMSYPAYEFKSEVVVLLFKLGLTLCETKQVSRLRLFSTYSNVVLRTVPLPSSQDISASPPSKSSLYPFSQLNSYAIPNPEILISTTAGAYPSNFICRTRQSKRSNPSPTILFYNYLFLRSSDICLLFSSS